LRAARDGDQVRQQVIAKLGRFELQASGQLERVPFWIPRCAVAGVSACQ